MLTNGLISIETRTPGGTNQWGEPLGDASEWGEPIECSIRANSDTRLGRYEGGEFRQASYTVLLEGAAIAAERVKLQRGCEQLGEYRVISITPMTVGRTQIIV